MRVIPIAPSAQPGADAASCNEEDGRVPKLDLPLVRRDFLKGSGLLTGAIATSSVLATLAPSPVWAVELKQLTTGEGKTLIAMGRVLFPHKKLPDAVYALLAKDLDGNAGALPVVRDGIAALDKAAGGSFSEAEQWKEMPLGSLTLIGKVDRIDRLPDGRALVMDYKSESREVTAERMKKPQEDTQLPFYAALLSDDELCASYVNLGEKESTKTYPQPDIVNLRDQLIESIQTDMHRIAEGAPMPAMGEGKACEYCEARGLCRRDFRVAA